MTEREKQCGHCGIVIWTTHDSEHPGLCCDCFDLKLATLNAERDKNGRAPITRPWPGRREDGDDSSSSG